MAWRTVGAIITRVVGGVRTTEDPIDEISNKKGHRYLMLVVDHDSRRLVWAAPGHDKRALSGFFDLPSETRCAENRLVSADAATWIGELVAARCPAATLCIDPFHVVSWATDALDAVRRQVWNDARQVGATDHAQDLNGARYALWKNPEHPGVAQVPVDELALDLQADDEEEHRHQPVVHPVPEILD